ncbi:MAG TPA: PPC domain-containing protein, partial [Archangium sp.]
TRVLADATNQRLTTSGGMIGELTVSEADLFRIDVPAAGVLRLDANAAFCNGFDSVQLALLDSSAAVLSTELNGAESACRVMVAQVQAGTYYVSLGRTATAMQPLSYWLTASLITTQGTEMEPNDTTNQANLLSGTDAVACGTLSPSVDLTDTYLFTLSQPANVHVEIIEGASRNPTCESGTLDSRVDLLSGAGLSLETDQGSGRNLCSRLETATPLGAGTYFLRVTETSTSRTGWPYCIVLRRW